MQQYSNTKGFTNLEELILACQPLVERMARKYADEWYRVEFDDFVQIGMLEICRVAPSAFEVAKNPVGYLGRVSQHAMINELRRMREMSMVSLDAPLKGDPSFTLVDLLSDTPPVRSPSSKKRSQALNAAIRRLRSTKQRAVVRRCYALPGYGAYSPKEVAQVLKCSSPAVTMLNERAREALCKDAKLAAAVGVGVGQ